MNWLKRLVPLLLLALVPCATYWEVFRGDLLLPTDWVYEELEPWKRLKQPGDVVNTRIKDAMLASYALDIVSANAAREGDVLLWNRFAGGGMPHLAGGFTRMLYPPFWIYAILEPATARNAEILIHLLMAAVFAFLFLRSVGGSTSGSLVGGIVFGLAPMIVHRAVMSFQLPTLIWFPILLLFIERLAVTGNPRYIVGLGLGVAMQLQAGYFPDMLTSFLGAAAYGVVRIFTTVPAAVGVRRLFHCIAGTVLGAALSSPFLLPALDLIAENNRPEASMAALSATGLGYEVFFTALSPWVHRSQLFIGLVPLLFVPLAFRHETRRVAFGLVAALALSIGIAAGTPLLSVLRWILPPIENLRYVHTLISVGNFALALLAGIGISQFLGRESGRVRLVAMVALALALGGWAVLGQEHVELLRLPLAVLSLGILLVSLELHRRRIVPASGLALLLVLPIGLELVSYARAVNPRIDVDSLPPFPEFEGIQFLRRDADVFRVAPLLHDYNSPFWPNTLGAYGIEDISAYHSLIPGSLGSYLGRLRRHAGGETRRELLEDFDNSGNWMALNRYRHSHLLRVWNIKYFLLPQGWENPDPATLEIVYDGEFRILRMNDSMPRAWLADEALVLPDERGAYAKLLDARFSPERTVLLEREPLCDFSAPGETVSPDSPESVDIVEYGAEHLVLQTGSPRASYLVLSQSYDAGWTAKVDGRDVRILRANVHFQSIPLAAGEHRVEISYRPAGYRWGWVAFVGALAASLALWWLAGASPQRPPAGAWTVAPVIAVIAVLVLILVGVAAAWRAESSARTSDDCEQLAVANRVLSPDSATLRPLANGSLPSVEVGVGQQLTWTPPIGDGAGSVSLLRYRLASASSPGVGQAGHHWILRDDDDRRLDARRVAPETRRWVHGHVPIPRGTRRLLVESTTAGDGSSALVGAPLFLTPRPRTSSVIVFDLASDSSLPGLSEYGDARLRVLLELGERRSAEASDFDEVYPTSTRAVFSTRLLSLAATLYRVPTVLVVAPSRSVEDAGFARRQVEILRSELEALGLDERHVEVRVREN